MKTNAEITDMVQMATRWDDAGNCHHGIEVGFDTRAGEREVMFVEKGLTNPQLATSTRPRPQGAMHDKTPAEAIAVCAAVDAEFWSLVNDPRTYFATRGGGYLRVKHIRQRALVEVTPVDAYGRDTSETTTHPAPADI